MTRKSLACVLLGAAIAGCGVEKLAIKNYEGPDRPVEQVALLKPQMFIRIHSIDGDTSKSFVTWKQFGSTDADMAFAPGIHRFAVSYRDSSAQSRSIMEIQQELLAGHRYLLRGTLGQNQTWMPQILDVTDRPDYWCISAPRC
jgi:hypothetical protein